MKPNTKYIIGVMSGTSLDGIDIAYIKLSYKDSFTFDIINAVTINYSKKWKSTLKGSFHVSGEKLLKLDADYGQFLGKILLEFINKNKISKIDFIASHGHTVFHNPANHYTFQLGNGAYIASVTGLKTICDFRTQDIALGGQGAPLVPIGDELLFSEYDYCLNLGGFSNISMKSKEHRIAFDICPVNIVLNHYVKPLNIDYDDKGKLASNGDINIQLLKELNILDFYNISKSKSLGYEFVVETIFPIIDKYKLDIKDILRTFIEHIAIQIAKIIDSNPSKKILVTGGGVYNDFLIERMQSYTKTKLIIPTDEIINYKEALIFGLLGFLRDSNKINCLKSVTGAVKNHCTGVIYN